MQEGLRVEWNGGILWVGAPDSEIEAPDMLTDLNLDQIFAAAGIAAQEAAVRPVRDLTTIAYRHEVFGDLEADATRAAFETFTLGMRSVRRHSERGQRLHHPQQRDRWQLDAEAVYCRTVREMRDALRELTLRASGLRQWRAWLDAYADGPEFRELSAGQARVRAELDAVRYTLHVTGRHVVVDRYTGQSDYSDTVAAAFARFRPGDDAVRPRAGDPWPDMNEVEEQVISAVTEQFPAVFDELARHAQRFRGFVDPMIARFDAELRFYLDYLGFVRTLAAQGLPYCYPEVTADFAGVSADGGYDAALAHTLAGTGKTVVRNDFRLDDRERVLVVTGPNQGGKSTFARMVGQLVYLAALGCPVPATRARIMLPDRLFTHFVRADDLTDPAGALAQELTRMRDILARTTEHSVVILNESLSTTTAADAAHIGGEVVRQLLTQGAVTVYVTFVEELATLGPRVVSMVAGVATPDDPVRTFRLERRPPDGLAYAAMLTHRHGLTYDAIRERIR
ncbi:DNA mismatch repair protein MutS [Nocardia sp. 2]|uniref:DNA mismatch repair protein MutS n=1 Tax=Nocardia acididurans TaxID=2802282 RepID=A0ABS1LZR1_9NOCA|nr:DNA mismatch repair protein MutS [Nocardia acididurans]MBL1073726.1 DNA mismatch repair protein MutS [Nocardia acididurans]